MGRAGGRDVESAVDDFGLQVRAVTVYAAVVGATGAAGATVAHAATDLDNAKDVIEGELFAALGARVDETLWSRHLELQPIDNEDRERSINRGGPVDAQLRNDVDRLHMRQIRSDHVGGL